jgi:hypothetical protein
MPTIRMTRAELADLVKRGAQIGPAVALPTGTLAPHQSEGMSEKDFTRLVLDLALANGWLRAHFRGVRVLKRNGETFWQTPVDGDGKGFLDLLLIHPERKLLCVAELKIPPNKLTPEQEDWKLAWEAVGVPAYVWTPAMWVEIVATLEGKN